MEHQRPGKVHECVAAGPCDHTSAKPVLQHYDYACIRVLKHNKRFSGKVWWFFCTFCTRVDTGARQHLRVPQWQRKLELPSRVLIACINVHPDHSSSTRLIILWKTTLEPSAAREQGRAKAGQAFLLFGEWKVCRETGGYRSCSSCSTPPSARNALDAVERYGLGFSLELNRGGGPPRTPNTSSCGRARQKETNLALGSAGFGARAPAIISKSVGRSSLKHFGCCYCNAKVFAYMGERGY